MKRTRSLLLMKRLSLTLAVLALMFCHIAPTSKVASAQVVEEWVERYSQGGYTPAYALAVDKERNVYVTGSGATIKYDNNGNPLWVASRSGLSIAVDDLGNIYVMGSYSSVKYDSNGNPLWEISRGGVAMAVDSACNVYVTNYQEGPDDPFNSNFATIKYDTDGNELWVATYNGPANSDSARAIAVDTTGHVYVTGSSTSSNGRRGYATIKYDSNGSVVWVAQLIRGSFADPVALAVDPAGNVYVTGTVFIVDPMDSRHVQGLYLTVKYDGNGNELWNKSYNRPNPLIYEPLDGASALSLDTSGNVYVTGRIEDLDTGQDYATIKYDTDGNELWVVRYNGPGSGFESGDSATAIAVDATDNVYVTGKSSGDYATVKYDSNGNELWVSRYNGPANGEDGAVAIAVDAAGNVYITGGSTSSDGTYDYATIKLKSDNTGSAVGGSSSGGGSRGCLIEAASEHHDHFNPSIVVLVLGCFIFLTTDALQYRKIK